MPHACAGHQPPLGQAWGSVANTNGFGTCSHGRERRNLKITTTNGNHGCEEGCVGRPGLRSQRGDAGSEDGEPAVSGVSGLCGSLRQALRGSTFQGEGTACAEVPEKQRPRGAQGSVSVEKRSGQEEHAAREEAGASRVGVRGPDAASQSSGKRLGLLQAKRSSSAGPDPVSWGALTSEK